MTDHDQLTFQNPVDRFREISPPNKTNLNQDSIQSSCPKPIMANRAIAEPADSKAAKHSLPVQTLGSVQQWPLRLPVKAPTSH